MGFWGASRRSRCEIGRVGHIGQWTRRIGRRIARIGRWSRRRLARGQPEHKAERDRDEAEHETPAGDDPGRVGDRAESQRREKDRQPRRHGQPVAGEPQLFGRAGKGRRNTEGVEDRDTDTGEKERGA